MHGIYTMDRPTLETIALRATARKCPAVAAAVRAELERRYGPVAAPMQSVAA